MNIRADVEIKNSDKDTYNLYIYVNGKSRMYTSGVNKEEAEAIAMCINSHSKLVTDNISMQSIIRTQSTDIMLLKRDAHKLKANLTEAILKQGELNNTIEELEYRLEEEGSK